MTSKHGVEFLKKVAEFVGKSKGFDRVTQRLKVTGGGDGRCIAEFTVGPEDINRGGFLHGGLTATIVDNITTYALLSKPCHPGVTVDLQVSYLTPAKQGDEIVIDANTVRAGRKLAYIECELRQKDNGTVVAKGGQTKYVED